ncbi:helix-turn-helix domain-containing protein [Arthrobacter sp. 754]|uniref:helix-turn-helix domain-containing protein n=1 Tax=Arthrobacter sp. 754 TaxID=3156315 RepID=UPI00339609BD
MDTRNDVQQFLTALRARITPEVAGLTVFGGERRVPGLRREEVAQLAGVSTAYYTRMERGDLSGVSESVLFALVRALQLNEAETAHLFDLTRAATGPRRAPRTKPELRVSRRVTQLINTMSDVPAIAMTRLGDPVASNPLGRPLFPDLFPGGKPVLNSARYLFLDERSKGLLPGLGDNRPRSSIRDAAHGRTGSYRQSAHGTRGGARDPQQ